MGKNSHFPLHYCDDDDDYYGDDDDDDDGDDDDDDDYNDDNMYKYIFRIIESRLVKTLIPYIAYI